MTKAIVVAASFVVAIGSVAAQTGSPRAVGLMDLTVPADRLPAGCALSDTSSRGRWAGLPITTNPWVGTDPFTVALIRGHLEPLPVVTDPPRTRREAANFLLQNAEGVEEAYAAVYAEEGATDLIVVLATRMAERASEAARARNRPPRNRAPARVEIGTIEAVFLGHGACFDAVAVYVQSLAAAR